MRLAAAACRAFAALLGTPVAVFGQPTRGVDQGVSALGELWALAALAGGGLLAANLRKRRIRARGFQA